MMAKTSSVVKRQLQQFKLKNGFYEEVEVTREEHKAFELLLESGNPLPEGVMIHRAANSLERDFFYRVETSALSDIEMIEYMIIKQAITLKHIKLATVLTAVLLVFVILFLFGLTL